MFELYLNRFGKACGLAVLLCVFPVLGFSAGFDCGKAHTKIEKRICADADTSRLDSLLQETYSAELKEVADPDKLKAEQRQWIKGRDQCLTLKSHAVQQVCIADTYYPRLGQLEKIRVARQAESRQSKKSIPSYPDIWLMRVASGDSTAGRVMPLYQLDQNVLEKLGLRDEKGDFFYPDYYPELGQYRLRGFFSGRSVLLKPVDRDGTAFRTDPGVLINNNQAVSPLPVGKSPDGAEVTDLKDGTYLRLKVYAVWEYGAPLTSDPCERATRALERVDRSGQVMWSRIYLVDARPNWSRLCAGAGSPANPDHEQYEQAVRDASYYFDDETLRAGVRSVYPLQDGTVLVGNWAHVLRIRLSDGLPGRAMSGVAAVDSTEMVVFKQAFKKEWKERHAEAERRLGECLKRYRVIRSEKDNFLELLEGRCKKEYKDPDQDERWYIQFNAELEQYYLSPLKRKT